MKKYLAIVAVVLMLIGCGSVSEPDENDINRLNEHAGKSTALPQTKPVKKQITSGDWEVGKKENLNAGIITAGTYVITATAGGFGCYWETVRNFDGDFRSIISNGNVDPGATARVNVKSSYAGLRLQNDCVAQKKK